LIESIIINTIVPYVNIDDHDDDDDDDENKYADNEDA
jgi:hypothetical protein